MSRTYGGGKMLLSITFIPLRALEGLTGTFVLAAMIHLDLCLWYRVCSKCN